LLLLDDVLLADELLELELEVVVADDDEPEVDDLAVALALEDEEREPGNWPEPPVMVIGGE